MDNPGDGDDFDFDFGWRRQGDDHHHHDLPRSGREGKVVGRHSIRNTDARI